MENLTAKSKSGKMKLGVVDKDRFTAIVGNLLKAAPIKRSEAKTGQPKTGKIIASIKPTK